MPFDESQPAFQALRDIVAERTTGIVAWVGAGLSVAAGLPTWNALRERLTHALEATIPSLDPEDQENRLARLSRIRATTDHWLAFQLIRDAIGSTSFRELIRKELQAAPSTPTPAAYSYLWKLRVSGVLNLNLDRLATRAYAEQHSGEPLEFSGFQVENAVHILKNPQPFIINLHGHHEDSSSWVITRKKLNALLQNGGYRQFISSCLTTRTVLFVGLSVDDVAVNCHLDDLLRKSSDTGAHYWITCRRDEETDRWAEDRQVRVIRYRAPNEDHGELAEFFDDLLAFVPTDSTPPPVTLQSDLFADHDLPKPEELARQDADTIRRLLNLRAKAIFSTERSENYEVYEEFARLYDEAIYRAWYTSEQLGQNSLLGYQLESRIARGAFGTVYKATDANGVAVAVKVLHEEVRREQSMLQSFRRGVKSMRILSEARIKGMVPYHDASEIPAFVVMDLIEGPNLHEAVEAGYLDDWRARLKVANDLASILHSAHTLPERVLHRDLRPPNVMLKGYYSNPDDYEVVVLDFDLSWHLGAAEKSLVIGSATTGYLAPEQLQQRKGVSTRHAAVDSFGLGMTLYFMISGRVPYPTNHEHVNWSNDVLAICRHRRCDEWQSLPSRFARAILRCTKTEQAERWDLGQVAGELSRLREALADPDAVDSADLLSEELLTRSQYGRSLVWDDDRASASVALSGGLSISVVAYDPGKQVRLEVGWLSAGDHAHRRIQKWLPDAGRKVQEGLESVGWHAGFHDWGSEQLRFSATIGVDLLRQDMGRFVSSVDSVCSTLSFE